MKEEPKKNKDVIENRIKSLRLRLDNEINPEEASDIREKIQSILSQLEKHGYVTSFDSDIEELQIEISKFQDSPSEENEEQVKEKISEIVDLLEEAVY